MGVFSYAANEKGRAGNCGFGSHDRVLLHFIGMEEKAWVCLGSRYESLLDRGIKEGRCRREGLRRLSQGPLIFDCAHQLYKRDHRCTAI